MSSAYDHGVRLVNKELLQYTAGLLSDIWNTSFLSCCLAALSTSTPIQELKTIRTAYSTNDVRFFCIVNDNFRLRMYCLSALIEETILCTQQYALMNTKQRKLMQKMILLAM